MGSGIDAKTLQSTREGKPLEAVDIPTPARVQEMIVSKQLTRKMLIELGDDDKFKVQAKRLLEEVDRANKAYDDLTMSRRNSTMLVGRCDTELAALEKLLAKAERKTEYLRMVKLREKLEAMEAEELEAEEV